MTDASIISHRIACPTCCAAMPKAELHIHIEGSLEPELIFALAARNGVAIPYASVEELRRGLRLHQPAELPGHLLRRRQRAGHGAGLLRHGLGLSAARRGRQRGARRDLLRSADAHGARHRHGDGDRGPAPRLPNGRSASWASSAQLILCFLRHLSEEEAFETLEQALPCREHFIGVGLDSSERGPPAGEVRARVRALPRAGPAPRRPRGRGGAAGLCLDGAGPAEGRAHRPRRAVGAGPGADAAAGAGPHPADRVPAVQPQAARVPHAGATTTSELLDAGLCATVNSDDPAYFGGYINDELPPDLRSAPAWTARHAYQLARNSFEGSFAEAAQKKRYIERLDAAFAAA